MLTRNHRQEALCRAYVQAVAALAGVATSVPTPDYGVDQSLRAIVQRGSRRLDGRLHVDLQLRSTTQASVADGEVSYDLDVSTYESLREPSLGGCLLVVLVLPNDEAEWVSQTVDELVVRRCAYWYSLRGAAPTKATSSVRVGIPQSQMFSAEAVRAIFDRLRQGDEL